MTAIASTPPATVRPADSPESWLAELLATRDGREVVVLYLVDLYLSPYKGSRGCVNILLRRLAGHLGQEERWAAFEELVTAVMKRDSTRMDAAVHSLCEVAA